MANGDRDDREMPLRNGEHLPRRLDHPPPHRRLNRPLLEYARAAALPEEAMDLRVQRLARWSSGPVPWS